MNYKVEPIEAGTGFMKRPYYVLINGEALRTSNGSVVRYKDSMTAALGGAREVDRLKRLAVHQASQMPAAHDSAPQREVK